MRSPCTSTCCDWTREASRLSSRAQFDERVLRLSSLTFGVVLFLSGCPKPSARSLPAPAPAPAPASTSTSTSTPPPPLPSSQLPDGGRVLFPTYRLVGFCGTPGAPALGELLGDLPKKTKALERYAEKYGDDRKVLPVFELIAVVVMSTPGTDGKYRHRVSDAVIDQYLGAARAAKALLLLNIQPGQSDFLTEVRHFEKYLREPDVGIALDPEWAMKGHQLPGRFYGQTTGAAINEVAEYLSGIVKEERLPEKAMVFHQVNKYVVKDEALLTPFPGVAIIKSVDGLGPKAAKIDTYRILAGNLGPGVHAGFKLFFDEDRRNGGTLMTAADVLALTPKPEYVMYE